jgi:hypothetical protein
MPDCQLRIVLDRHDRTYRGGQTIAGRVVVSATGNVRCDGLRIERNWRTRGKGNTDSGPGDRHVLFRGQWQQGERYEYPFQFIAPAAPLSYHGRYIQIEHFVEAGADVPWAFDPKATEIITLRPGGSGGPVEAPPGVRWSPLMEQTFKTAAGIGGMVAGVMMFFLGVALFFPLGFVLVPAAIVLFTYSLLKQLVYQAVTVKVDFNPTVVPGQSAPLTLRVMPTKMLNITKVTARVRGLESCTSGSGKSRSHHRHAVHDQTDTLMESRQVAVGQTLEIRHDLKLPSTDALSFATMNNKITWELKLRIYIPMWPDWTQTIQLMVGPERRPAMEEAGASTADAVESAAVVQLVEVPVRQPRQPLVSRETPAPPRPPARRDAQRWEPQGSTLQPASDTVAGEDAVRQVQEPAPQPEPATVAAVVNPQPQVAAGTVANRGRRSIQRVA